MTVLSWHPAYASVRMAAWWALWIAVHIDACLHRYSRGRGWKLHRGIAAFLTTEVVFQTLHLAVVAQHWNSDSFNLAHSAAFRIEIFFDWLAKSGFLFLILLVSAGYCILRDNLGEHWQRVVAIPVVYGVTSMVFDYILLSTSNEQVVTQTQAEDEEIDAEDLKVLVLVVCLLVKAVVFVCAWIFVFEHLNREIRLLRGEPETLEEPEPDVEEAGEYQRPELQTAVEGQNGVDTERAAEEPKTMADAIGDQAKLLLLGRFKKLLIIYIVSIILVNFLPIYIGNTSVEKLQNVTIVCENVILFIFIAAMSIIFRPVGDNPYLLLIEDEGGEEEGKEVTTELGVMSFEPPTPQQAAMTLPEPQPEVGDAAPTFALADEEDMDLMSPQRRQLAPSSPIAASTPKLQPPVEPVLASPEDAPADNP